MVKLIQFTLSDEDIIHMKDFYRQKHYVFLVEIIIDKLKNGDIKIDNEIFIK